MIIFTIVIITLYPSWNVLSFDSLPWASIAGSVNIEVTATGLAPVAKRRGKLWDQGLFENVGISATKIEANLIFLQINLKERPRVSKFSFTGLRKSEADDIRTKINLTRGDVATDHLFLKTKMIIKDHFAEKGYLNADVEIKQTPDPQRDNYVDLSIDIQEKHT